MRRSTGMAGVVSRWIVGDLVQRPLVVAQLDEDLVWVQLKGGEWTVGTKAWQGDCIYKLWKWVVDTSIFPRVWG